MPSEALMKGNHKGTEGEGQDKGKEALLYDMRVLGSARIVVC
jgi:hypothetical protein